MTEDAPGPLKSLHSSPPIDSLPAKDSGEDLMKRALLALGALASTGVGTLAIAADAPTEVKIGTLYASSGRYASISMPVHNGLKLWIDQKNA